MVRALVCMLLQGKGKGHPRTGHEGPEGELRHNYSFFNLGARWGWVVSVTPRPLYSWKDPVPIV
jgi:hypothetical protein